MYAHIEVTHAGIDELRFAGQRLAISGQAKDLSRGNTPRIKDYGRFSRAYPPW
jgi:hypothetical protein